MGCLLIAACDCFCFPSLCLTVHGMNGILVPVFVRLVLKPIYTNQNSPLVKAISSFIKLMC